MARKVTVAMLKNQTVLRAAGSIQLFYTPASESRLHGNGYYVRQGAKHAT